MVGAFCLEKNEKDNGNMQHIFIVGCKGIPGHYGGYETFVDKLTEYHQDNQSLHYYVACRDDLNEEQPVFKYHNATCFNVKTPNIGSARAILYDVRALKWCCQYIQAHQIEKPIVYVLACRIGPFFSKYVRRIHQLGGKVFVNPDGHEWMRAKWSKPVRKYWKYSEKLMVKHADLLVCDSKNIEKYIQETYAEYAPKTTFIAYGSETKPSSLKDDDPKFTNWLREHKLRAHEYYLVVGRFVPENNYETMIAEFMKSHTKKDFAIIATTNDALLDELQNKLFFRRDRRIKFVGTVYDSELLKKIRENAYGYFHGHEVGGTNPSLLEALGSTKLNLLLKVGFNEEVGEDAALYWTKKPGNLASLIDRADQLDQQVLDAYGEKAKKRIQDAYSWPFIADQYRKIFCE
jgi:rhamnosyltransferase